jgi:hypothetical protein
MNGAHIGQVRESRTGISAPNGHLEAVGNFTGGGDRDLLWITEASATAIWHLDGAHVSASQVSAPTGDSPAVVIEDTGCNIQSVKFFAGC